MRKLFVSTVIAIAMVTGAAEAATRITISDFELWSSTYESDLIRIVPTTRQNPENCADADSYFVLKAMPEAIKARLYSTLLSAKAAGRSVDIVLQGCESGRPAVVTAILR